MARDIHKKKTGDSYLEEVFDKGCFRYGIFGSVREYRLVPDRQWRFDRAWPKLRVAVEIQGGTYGGPDLSYHTAGKRYQNDCQKYNRAQMEGWIVLLADREMAGDYEFIVGVLKKTLLQRIALCKRMGLSRLNGSITTGT